MSTFPTYELAQQRQAELRALADRHHKTTPLRTAGSPTIRPWFARVLRGLADRLEPMGHPRTQRRMTLPAQRLARPSG
ncbi:hypothetical protein SAMN05421678_12717 [Actinopolymorpha cephalotaxi]|uniref:Uncharacterized protein n=1 Tax=Actinopolymorpha cephalotaxi TaxID=504797 RepID=A0A1I3BVC1_9ACTN|nr:hypothetical protein [Actinopolymorpha cephalotaxi]NYH86305.1 hypothetical protein [Actinopolymorpha cephalotaxi]SFH66237.1 hypothetical protein SAMN05421678_12717 [Actinopolymorpha cephalotaxi]